MNKTFKAPGGFTLVEMLVVIAVIAVLVGLILPVTNRPKRLAMRAQCLNNLRQINFAVRMYSDDASDVAPSPAAAASSTNFATLYSGYKQFVKSYVGLNGASSAQDKIFACPADAFYPNHIFTDDSAPTAYVKKPLHEESFVDYSSYSFNGGDGRVETAGTNGRTFTRLGLGNVKLSAVKHPSRTVLVAEASALTPWSWHKPSSQFIFNDAENVASFVDGHVNFIKIYLAPNQGLAVFYNPPGSYDYQWTPD